MDLQEIEKIKVRNAMLESNNRILIRKSKEKDKKHEAEIKQLEKIIKDQDLEIQRLTNGI